MENNIDKILRNALENHEEMPPSDSWTHIHTEISKPNKRLLTPVLVALFLGFLLISGVGLSIYYVSKSDEKLIVSSLKSKPLFTSENVQNSGQKEVLISKNSPINSPKLSIFKDSFKQILPLSVSTAMPSENDLTQDFSEIKGNAIAIPDLVIDKQINETQPVELLAKSYVFPDLSEKMNQALANVIPDDYLEEEFVKADSVVEEIGKKFSLKHPIINFRLGMYNNSVNMSAKEGGEIPFVSDVINPNSIYGFSGIFNMAWKLNKKSRVSLNFKLISYGAVNVQSKSGAAYVDPLSSINKPSGTFKYNPSKGVYEYLTPLGYVTQLINPNSSARPKDFDVYFGGSTTNWQIGLNYEYDLVAFRHKKGGIPAMEIYGLVGFNIQKIRKHISEYYLFKNYDPQMNNYNYIMYPTNITSINLENGSPIVFGYNTGLGIRLQLSKRFGLNISGNYESNINSWVKDLPFTTRLSVLSVESGFFVNL